MKHDALMHDQVDDVAVVIHDVAESSTVTAVTLDGAEVATVTATQDIPLGHKIALRDLAAGHKVVKYGRVIGQATQAIAQGNHVHTQNVKSVRWA